MLEKDYKKIEEIMEVGESAIGKTFSQIDKNNRLSNIKNKGVLGQIIEESLFKIKVNSRKAPDFERLGIELKLTGLKRTRNGLTAKERLVIETINFEEDIKTDFYTSRLYEKLSHIFLITYIYEENQFIGDFEINSASFLHIDGDDMQLIMEDWEVIINKIKEGKAHELSESDTKYLAASTKGANAEQFRKQPFSEALAKQRAFSLKPPLFMRLVNKSFEKNQFELLHSLNQMDFASFQETVINRFSQFIGKTEDELCNIFNISKNEKNKSRFSDYVSRMFGLRRKINNVPEIENKHILFKTVRIGYNGTNKEHISLPAFEYTKIINETWNESSLRIYFADNTFCFMVFQENIRGDYYFRGSVFWKMNPSILDKDVFRCWEETREVINSGNIVSQIKKQKDGRLVHKNNFPGAKKYHYVHVRPHAANFEDKFPLPVPDKLTGKTGYMKMCFWLTNDFILEVVESELQKKTDEI